MALGISWADEPVFSPLRIGSDAPWFSLPSSQDRLIDYAKDYFGKHHLVMTFFPAAFTPV
jgi:peroxiredoxin